MNIIKRKPWRSKAPIFAGWHKFNPWYINIWINVLAPISWIRAAHDCQDPRVGCSCYGSYRFPKV